MYKKLLKKFEYQFRKNKKLDISSTGYWDPSQAHLYHAHSKPLSVWIGQLFSEDKSRIVYDFGCGLGNYLKDLNAFGFENLQGYEGAPPVKKVFSKIIQFDLSKPLKVEKKGNVISLEVGEHIPEEYMSVYLDNICNACDGFLVISWAIRNQPGDGHVNCRENYEVIPEFIDRGFNLRVDLTRQVRSIISEDTWWFKDTLLVFEKFHSYQ